MVTEPLNAFQRANPVDFVPEIESVVSRSRGDVAICRGPLFKSDYSPGGLDERI